VWTVGYGHNLEAHNEPIPKLITQQEAEDYLSQDIQSAVNDCINSIPCFANLDSVRQAVLVDMCFNLGIKGLLGFKQTLTYVSNGEYEQAASQMLLSKWAKQVTWRAERLAKQMRTGEWEGV